MRPETMVRSQSDLPSYKGPPLDEIAIAVQFEELGLHAVHYGLIYDVFKDEFPLVEEQHAIPAKFETFPTAPFGLQFQMKAHDRPPLPRAWFLAEDKHNLVQFQPDRLIRNWRKIEGVGTYPRFDSIYPKFEEAYRKCEDALMSNALGELRPNQCELSYFNNVLVEDGDSFSATLKKYFGPALTPAGLSGGSLNLMDEFARVTLISQMLSETNEPVGRLYVEATPASGEGKEMIRVQLIARGRPAAPSLEGATTFLSIAHSTIVRAFDFMTTDYAKRVWQKESA